MKYTPMRHQQIAIDFCLKHPRAGLLMGMGLGKTAETLALEDPFYQARSYTTLTVINETTILIS